MKISYIIISLVATVLIVLAGYGYLQHVKTCDVCLSFASFTPETIRHYVRSFGPWGIGAYVLLYVINTMTLVPPIAFLSLSAGALFGPIGGTIALGLGAFCGVTATFIVSRTIGGRLIDRFVKGKAAAFNEKLGRNGFLVLLPIRLIGFPPYEFVNYASGLSKISYKDYIAASMIGMAPAIIIQVLLADRLTRFDPKDPLLYIAAALFIAMIAVTSMIIKKKQAKADISHAQV
jgi:uncharacterized membrane protein YdjX (TVP38/TMEM64 family)